MASARSLVSSFNPVGALWLTGADSDSSAPVLNRGAVAGRSKGKRFSAGEPSDEIAASVIVGSGEAAVPGTLTLVWHFGQRTVKGLDGVFASSSCKRASHFEQIRTMVVSQLT